MTDPKIEMQSKVPAHVEASLPREEYDAAGTRAGEAKKLLAYRRFWRRSRYALPGVEDSGVTTKFRNWMDRKLMVTPSNQDAGIRSVKVGSKATSDEVNGLSFDQAELEFQAASTDEVEAWVKRKRLEATWQESEEYRRSRKNSVLASFVGILVTHTGLYPTKIPAIGVDFPALSKPAFLFVMLLIIWYLNFGMNALVRSYILERAFLEIEHAQKGVYRNFINRYTFHIWAVAGEKQFFDRRLPNMLCLYASVSILYALARDLVPRIW